MPFQYSELIFLQPYQKLLNRFFAIDIFLFFLLDCRAVCHPDCKDSLPLPCVPRSDTPGSGQKRPVCNTLVFLQIFLFYLMTAKGMTNMKQRARLNQGNSKRARVIVVSSHTTKKPKKNKQLQIEQYYPFHQGCKLITACHQTMSSKFGNFGEGKVVLQTEGTCRVQKNNCSTRLTSCQVNIVPH